MSQNKDTENKDSKNKDSKKKENKNCYTKEERQKKINNIKIEIMTLDIPEILNPQVNALLKLYEDTGITIEKDIDFHFLHRKIIIRLYNSKNVKSYVNLKEMPIEDYSREANKLNKRLNELKSQGVDFSKK